MIASKQIKKAVNKILYEKYKLPIYGSQILEGYKKPCFFVQIELDRASFVNRNIIEKVFVINIYYFQREKDEHDIMTKMDQLLKEIGAKLLVNDRSLEVSDISFNLTGEARDILKMEFTISFYDNQDKTDEADIAKELEINTKAED